MKKLRELHEYIKTQDSIDTNPESVDNLIKQKLESLTFGFPQEV